MTKVFYKLDEYPFALPNPRQFPIADGIPIAIGDYPNAFSNGFILDFSVTDADKLRLEKMAQRVYPKQFVDRLLELCKKSSIQLSEPQYIYTDRYVSYVLIAPGVEPIAIQVQWYRYFRKRYKNCEFFTDKEPVSVKSVKLDNDIVGLWMVVYYPDLPDKIF